MNTIQYVIQYVIMIQIILNNSLYIQLSVGLGLSSASFSMYITTNNGTFWRSGCLDLLPCEPTSDSTSGANVQGMYCKLDLVYTPCIEVSFTDRPKRSDCQVGLLSYILLVNLYCNDCGILTAST